MKYKSLRGKFTAYIVSLITGILLVYMIVFTAFTYSMLKRQIEVDSQFDLDFLSNHIETIRKEIKEICSFVAIDKDVQAAVYSEEDISDGYYIAQRYGIMDVLRKYKSLKNYILSIQITTEDGRLYSTDAALENYDFISKTWGDYKEFSQKKITDTFTELQVSGQGSSERTAITYISECNDLLGTKSNFAHIFVTINFNIISQLLCEALPDADSIRIFRGDGEEIFSVNLREPQAPEERSIVIERSLFDGEWEMKASISRLQVFSKISGVFALIAVLFLISAVLVITCSVFVIKRLTSPLREINSAARRVAQGDLDVKVNLTSADEMQKLGDTFNYMTRQLKVHIAENLKNEETKNRLQMELLMAQINPHFIYNTLNSVIYLANLKKYEDITVLCRKFVAILQDNLKIGDEGMFTSVSSEVATVRDYCDIQRIKYCNQFSVEYKIEEGTEDCIVPRLILQPIVENSLFHGILSSEKNGRIEIRCSKEKENLRLSVTDNGVGMTKEKCRELALGKSRESTSSYMRSVGISNIVERLRVIYGESYELSINSREDKGTEIIIVLPINNK